VERAKTRKDCQRARLAPRNRCGHITFRLLDLVVIHIEIAIVVMVIREYPIISEVCLYSVDVRTSAPCYIGLQSLFRRRDLP
jgi:hypothetical protein